MSDRGYNEFIEKINDLEKFIGEKFETNAREHKKTNKHLANLNSKVEKHEAWKNQQDPTLTRWKEEERSKKSKTYDFFIKVIAGLVVGSILTFISILVGSNYM